MEYTGIPHRYLPVSWKERAISCKHSNSVFFPSKPTGEVYTISKRRRYYIWKWGGNGRVGALRLNRTRLGKSQSRVKRICGTCLEVRTPPSPPPETVRNSSRVSPRAHTRRLDGTRPHVGTFSQSRGKFRNNIHCVTYFIYRFSQHSHGIPAMCTRINLMTN